MNLHRFFFSLVYSFVMALLATGFVGNASAALLSPGGA